MAKDEKKPDVKKKEPDVLAVPMYKVKDIEAMDKRLKKEKEKKKAQDDLVKTLTTQLDDLFRDAVMPPKDGFPDDSPMAKATGDPVLDKRAVQLKTLGFKANTLKMLAENNPAIITIGNLCDWQAKHGDFWMKNIKGLAKAAWDEFGKVFEDFEMQWLKNHPAKDAKPEKPKK